MVCLIEWGPLFSLPKAFLVTANIRLVLGAYTAHRQPERVTPLITEWLRVDSVLTAPLATGSHVLPRSLASDQHILRMFTLRIPFFPRQ